MYIHNLIFQTQIKSWKWFMKFWGKMSYMLAHITHLVEKNIFIVIKPKQVGILHSRKLQIYLIYSYN